MATIEIARGHIQDRALSRIEETQILAKAFASIAKRIKSKNVPNSNWYRTVYKDKQIVGHICGRGCYIATVLAPHMIPKGARI